MSVKLTLSLFIAALAIAHSANILDLLNWEDGKKLLEAIQPQEKAEVRNDINCKWKCKGPACACCIDTNITNFDPEEAKCIHMRYMSKDDGFFVQVSYGKKVDYDKIQLKNSGPLCLVASVMFQMCAVFSQMASTRDGLSGCVHFEPGTVFAPQSKIPLGCFKANDAGMEMMEPSQELLTTIKDVGTESETESEADESEGDVEFDPNKFFAGVYQTAKQSIAFLSTLLETADNSTKPETTTTMNSSEQTEEPETARTHMRAPKNLKHPNQL